MEKVKCSVTKQGNAFVKGVEEGVKIGKEQEQKRIMEIVRKAKYEWIAEEYNEENKRILNLLRCVQQSFDDIIKQIQSQETKGYAYDGGKRTGIKWKK